MTYPDIKLLSIQPINNVVAFAIDQMNNPEAVTFYWYPRFVAIYSSRSAENSEVELHQIYLRNISSPPTTLFIGESNKYNLPLVRDVLADDGQIIIAKSYLDEYNFTLLFRYYQKLHNDMDFVADHEQKKILAENAEKDLKNLIDELKGNGINITPQLNEISESLIKEANDYLSFYHKTIENG